MTDWNKIVEKIQYDEAVLVLGPDAIPFYPTILGSKGNLTNEEENQSDIAEETFSSLSKKEIQKKLGYDQILHHYKRDNLFLFSDDEAKQEARDAIRSLVQQDNWLPSEDLLRQIVSIPFSVIINLNPDLTVFNAFNDYFGRPPQFDYFTCRSKGKGTTVFTEPKKDNPFLFNLCGNAIKKPDSVILDYYDLFKYIKKLLTVKSLPSILSEKLKSSNRFILLGFELERWYFQLFLHYINTDSKPFKNYNKNYPILSKNNTINLDTKKFLLKQFKIDHISTTRAAFTELYECCKEKGLMRKIKEDATDLCKEVRRLLGQNDFDQTFVRLLDEMQDKEIRNHIINLKGSYNAIRERVQGGTLNPSDASYEYNRIRGALLTYACNPIQNKQVLVTQI